MAEIETETGIKCEVEGCDWLGTACFYPDNSIYGLSDEEIEAGEAEKAEPDHYYCAKHAHKSGFCFGCGEFWGGVESFDFGAGARSGLCENCLSNGDFDDEEEEEDDGYYFEDDESGGYYDEDA